MSETKATFCPNCSQPAIRTGNEIACEKCDAVFTVTQKQEAKVKQLGPIQDLDRRVTQLETFAGEAIGEKPQETKPEPEDDDDI